MAQGNVAHGLLRIVGRVLASRRGGGRGRNIDLDAPERGRGEGVRRRRLTGGERRERRAARVLEAKREKSASNG